MKRPALHLLMLLLFTNFVAGFCHAQQPCGQEITQQYSRALKYFNTDNPTNQSDSLALNHFATVIHSIANLHACDNADVLYDAYLKSGILYDVRAEYDESRRCYLQALRTYNGNTQSKDSIQFQLYVFLGSAYYHLNKFDSSRIFLSKAEALLQPSTPTNDKARLFNTIGVLYYDNGNYRQGKNYFTKALSFAQTAQTVGNAFAVNIQTNIATAHYKLGDYQLAMELYNSILKYGIGSDYIWMNLGRTNLALNKNAEALECFRHINANALPGVYNEMALAHIRSRKSDSAWWCFDRFEQLQKNQRVHFNKIDKGISKLYQSELLENEKSLMPALQAAQSAIIAFSNRFTDTSIFANPPGPTGSFAYFRLFEALDRKAGLLTKLHSVTGNIDHLKAAYECYRLTLDFLDYIEKNYDTDEAKILLKKKSRDAYENAVAVCISLYYQDHQKKHLEDAFAIAEKNKGSIVASNVHDLMLSSTDTALNRLSTEIRNIRFAIARLNIRIEGEQEKEQVQELITNRTSYELQLAELSKRMESSNSYYSAKYQNQSPSIKDLQQLLNRDQAIVSYYVGKGHVYIFLISAQRFQFVDAGEFAGIDKPLRDWLHELKKTESGYRFKGYESGRKISEQLISAAMKQLQGMSEWIIIPDGLLCQLPFESLPIGQNRYGVLESLAVSYELSSKFLVQRKKPELLSDYSVVSFAPFSQGSAGIWSGLPGSLQETDGLAGTHFVGPEATRQQFLDALNNSPVLHLATHALASNSNPMGSFVAFYPSSNDSLNNNVYLQELYGLRMDNTRLVIVSACETGEGELVSSEGIMSLARGFAYAGSESTVNSLWKANDASTAYILRQFHIYLKKGFSKSKALQKARLDYIRSHDMRVSPPYWANLMIIGDNSALCKKEDFEIWSWLAAGVLLIAIPALAMERKKSRRNTGQRILTNQVYS